MAIARAAKTAANRFNLNLRWSDPVFLTAVYTAGVSALFILFPRLDLAVTRLFYDGIGFPATQSEILVGLRNLGKQLVIFVVVALTASFVAKLVWPKLLLPIRARIAVFLLASLAVGPGLIVNGLFKEIWGRPRPIETTHFGGEAPFVPAWLISDHCASNCSFVSGEASSAAWLLALGILAPARLRVIFTVLIATFAFLLSVNRIAFGGHYLSDVMISWGITMIVTLVMYRLIIQGTAAMRIDAAAERLIARLGEVLWSDGQSTKAAILASQNRSSTERARTSVALRAEYLPDNCKGDSASHHVKRMLPAAQGALAYRYKIGPDHFAVIRDDSSKSRRSSHRSDLEAPVRVVPKGSGPGWDAPIPARQNREAVEGV